MNADRAEAAFWAAFLRNRNVEAKSAADGAIAVAGGYAISIGGTVYQMALAVGSARPLAADDLDVLAGFYGLRGVSTRLELREEALERDWALLERSGYTVDEGSIALLEAPAESQPPVRAIAVRVTADRGAWAALAAQAFADGAAPAEQLRSAQIAAAAATAVFVAEIDGVKAGVGALGIAGEIAFLYSGAVLPAFRGRGVHGALLRARVAFAAGRGAGRTALKAQKGSTSERSALRAGFTPSAALRRVRSSGPS